MKSFRIFEAGTQSVVDQERPVGGYKSKEEVFDKPEEKTNVVDIRVKYSKELESLLKELEDANNYVAFELLWLGEPAAKYFNGLKIENVEVSKVKDCFDVTIGGKTHAMQIKNFIKYYFKNLLGESEVTQFLRLYQSAKTGEDFEGMAIKVGEFSYNPKDVRSTFLSLVTKTYPHGHEDEVLQFLPKLNKDIVGNYYIIIGDSKPETMFTSHLDTADREQKVTKLYSFTEDEQEYIVTDGNSILGADDKAGVAVMLYMISNNVPGLYYFFIGEERGGIGSGQLSYVYDDVDYLKNIKRCVSFDRRDTCSVITSQLGRTCCSNNFATALAEQYNSHGLKLSLDPTGVYTDSASFLENISECTNISVGYYREHTKEEKQNITYLKKLAEASTKVDWNSLPTVRRLGLNQEVLRKYSPLIAELKRTPFLCDVKVVTEDDGVTTVIQCDLEEGNIEDTYETLTMLQFLLNKHKLQQAVYFDNEYLKIELK